MEATEMRARAALEKQSWDTQAQQRRASKAGEGQLPRLEGEDPTREEPVVYEAHDRRRATGG